MIWHLPPSVFLYKSKPCSSNCIGKSHRGYDPNKCGTSGLDAKIRIQVIYINVVSLGKDACLSTPLERECSHNLCGFRAQHERQELLPAHPLCEHSTGSCWVLCGSKLGLLSIGWPLGAYISRPDTLDNVWIHSCSPLTTPSCWCHSIDTIIIWGLRR